MSKQLDRRLMEVYQFAQRRKQARTFHDKYAAVLDFLAYLKQFDNSTMNMLHRFYVSTVDSNFDFETLKATNSSSGMSDLS